MTPDNGIDIVPSLDYYMLIKIAWAQIHEGLLTVVDIIEIFCQNCNW
jgi:hypothetical protein